MRRSFGVLLLAGLGATVDASVPQATYLALPISPVQLGMADVTSGAGDVLAGWTNPAEVTLLSSRLSLQAGAGSLFDSLMPVTSLGAAWRWPRWALAAYYMSLNVAYPRVDALGEETGTEIEHAGRGLGAITAWRFGPVGFGFSVKQGVELFNEEERTSWIGQAGAVVGLRGFTAGVSYGQVGALSFDEAELRLGARYRHDAWRASLGAEMIRRYGTTQFGFGVEWRPVDLLRARGGLGGIGELLRPAFGVGAMWKGIGIDYGFMAHPLGITHQISLGYAWGERPGW